jgi:hypothetical protein
MKFNFLLTSAFISSMVSAQIDFGKYGSISGSFETINQLYVKDDATNAVLPQDRIGSNNYFKADYRLHNFSAGIQYEAYLPSLQGYPFILNEAKLVQKYFSYKASKFDVTVGNFYAQFGSGLLFRSWENRQLGINNAMEGIRIGLKPIDKIEVKFIYGKQRNDFDKSEGTIRALDFNWNFIDARESKKENHLSFGAGLVSRYQEYTGPDPTLNPTVNAFGTRIDYANSNTGISAEYVFKGKDPHLANQQNTGNGSALLINYNYNKKNFGLNINLRTLDNMDFRTDRDADQSSLLINYLPALTKQQEFYLSNIYVYNAQVNGEIGGQADIYYHIPENTWLGGKTGMSASFNISRFHSIDSSKQVSGGTVGSGKQVYYNDININIRKKHSDQLTSNFLAQHIYYNKSVVEGGNYENIKSTIMAGDILLKYTPKKSLRVDIQLLFTSQDRKNWIGSLVEWSYAPHYNIFLSDMYNYGNVSEKVHYYNFGGGYSMGRHKILASYGRQRAGLVCVGGVCRQIPAATGLNLSFTSSF